MWKSPEAHPDAVLDAAWSPLVPHWLASAGADGSTRVWDVRFAGRLPVRTLHAHASAVTHVAWSKAHCEVLLTGGNDNTLRTWNLRSAPHFLTATVATGFDETRHQRSLAAASAAASASASASAGAGASGAKSGAGGGRQGAGAGAGAAGAGGSSVSAPVCGLGFSSVNPLEYFGVSAAGNVLAVRQERVGACMRMHMQMQTGRRYVF